MYRLINHNAAAVIKALDRIGDLNEYLRLRAKLVSDRDATSDAAFRRSYRRYWRMNAARLPESFYSRYFKVLAQCQRRRHADVATVARTTSDAVGANHGLQFSFATKLAHMVDPHVPVFDSFVANFYFYAAPSSDRPFEDRLASLLEFHSFLSREYARVIRLRLLAPAIDQLRSECELESSVPDERVVDWLIWAWVSLLRTGAQVHGQALYD